MTFYSAQARGWMKVAEDADAGPGTLRNVLRSAGDGMERCVRRGMATRMALEELLESHPEVTMGRTTTKAYADRLVAEQARKLED